MSPRTVFVREATGLVREYSPIEGFISNFGNVSPIFSAAFTTFFIYYAVPGGDVVFNTFLGMMCGILGYVTAIAMLSASMPRSGAPYVIQSRILHPSIGFAMETMMWLALCPAMASYATAYINFWALAPGLYVLGQTTGNPALVEISSVITTPIWSTAIGTAFLLFTFLVAVLGVRLLLRYYQRILFAVYLVGLVVMFAVLATSNHADFVSKFNAFVGQNYDDIISIAKNAYPYAFAPVAYTAAILLPALGMTGGTTNTYWTSYYTGEMKRAGTLTGQLINMVASCVALGFGVIAIVALEEVVIGRDFLVAITQLSTNSPGQLAAPLVRGGVATNFPIFILASPPVQVLWLITLIAAALLTVPAIWMAGSRLLLAWSFDRLLPSKLAEVNDRFHTPIMSLAVFLVVSEIFLLMMTWTTYLGQLLAFTWMFSFIPISFTCLSAIVFPFRKKLYDLSPAKSWKIGAIPIVAIVGLVGFLYNVNSAYQYWVLWLGTNPWFIAFFVASFILYWIIRAIRKSQGIDTDLLFAEIPPE